MFFFSGLIFPSALYDYFRVQYPFLFCSVLFSAGVLGHAVVEIPAYSAYFGIATLVGASLHPFVCVAIRDDTSCDVLSVERRGALFSSIDPASLHLTCVGVADVDN